MTEVRGKKVTVAGLGRFGGQMAAARWLVEQGAQVLVTDRTPAEKLADSVRQLQDLPITWRLGEHRREDFEQTDLVVASPAIPLTNEYLVAARKAGVEITAEIRLFVERCPAAIIGVTGTKGKSTTATLLGRMLEKRFKTWVGGNIGKPLLLDLPKIKKEDLVVLELSSFMLEHLSAMRWSPHVALITMIAADHIEWHGSVDAYVQAKKNIIRFQKADDVAVLNSSDEVSKAFAKDAVGHLRWFPLQSSRKFELTLPGEHNQLNAQGAFATANVFGITWEEANETTRTFSGLHHRLELVCERDGVRYYDDSIATIPQAAVAALDAFAPRTVIQIIGGQEHGLDIAGMCESLRGRAKGVLCIGQTGNKLADAPSASASDVPPVYRCGDMKSAVETSQKTAKPGDIILLRTGYKSFDQFDNYEQRGNTFAELARQSSASG